MKYIIINLFYISISWYNIIHILKYNINNIFQNYFIKIKIIKYNLVCI